MKSSNTSMRLKQIIKEKNLRQVDILLKCEPLCKEYGVKLGRNDLSQYVNGKVEPGQEKLTILGKALNVNEVWLMGYDVPMNPNESTHNVQPLIMQYYDTLNSVGKHEATKRVEELTYLDRYTIVEKPYLKLNAAHRRTDIDIPDDIDTSDDDIMDDENF